MTKADSIYTDHTLHSLPHRLRVRQVISVLRRQTGPGMSYADVGCGDGFVTAQIARALQCTPCVGYDFNEEVLNWGKKLYPEIDFRRWDFTSEAPPNEKYSLVTCLETLEHVSDLHGALKSLLSITQGLLLVTVPIETGAIGVAKFAGKVLLGRDTLTKEHEGSKLDYFRRLLRGDSISHFRQHPDNGHWKMHTGFDYRELDKLLREEGVPFEAKNRGWNRFYLVRGND